jgi:hypothetical protein
MRYGGKAKVCLLAAAVAISAAAAVGSSHSARAVEPDPQAAHEKCAERLSIAVLGLSPSAALLGDANPQSQVDTMVQAPEFIERFSRFVNQQLNDDPGAVAAEDSAYYMTKYALEKGLAWKDVFSGPYNVVAGANANAAPTVQADPQGLGYFRSTPWKVRYAGNEEEGLKISTAYRMMNNIVGLTLVASTNAPGADISATGRKAPACAGCHYDSWYALDKVAQTLDRVKRTGMNVTFDESLATQQPILDGQSLKGDKALVDALVNSEQFQFRACRLAFKFLYGRDENVCEAPVFDKCVDELKASGKIQNAVAAVAKDSTFCGQ